MSDRFYIKPDDLLVNLRKRLASRAYIGLRGISTLFREAETDSSHLYSVKSDIPRILSGFGVFMNKTEVIELTRHLGDGEITISKFVEYFYPKLNDVRENWVSKALIKYDPGKTGALEIGQLKTLTQQRTVLTRLATRDGSPETLFQNLWQWYENAGEKVISRENFFDYYRVIGAGIQDDREFATLIQGTWGVGK